MWWCRWGKQRDSESYLDKGPGDPCMKVRCFMRQSTRLCRQLRQWSQGSQKKRLGTILVPMFIFRHETEWPHSPSRLNCNRALFGRTTRAHFFDIYRVIYWLLCRPCVLPRCWNRRFEILLLIKLYGAFCKFVSESGECDSATVAIFVCLCTSSYFIQAISVMRNIRSRSSRPFLQ